MWCVCLEGGSPGERCGAKKGERSKESCVPKEKMLLCCFCAWRHFVKGVSLWFEVVAVSEKGLAGNTFM